MRQMPMMNTLCWVDDGMMQLQWIAGFGEGMRDGEGSELACGSGRSSKRLNRASFLL